jgi:hypothetical protein
MTYLLAIEQIYTATVHVAAWLLSKIRVSLVFLDPIKDCISLRSAILKAVYLKALQYSKLHH